MMQVSDGILGQCGGSLPVPTNDSFPQANSESSATDGSGDWRGRMYGKCRQPGCRSGRHRDLDVHGTQRCFYASATKSFLEVYQSWPEFSIVTHLKMVDEHVLVSNAIQLRCFSQ
jgi:hypothetical protein